jgi:hypothetical protein
VSDPSRQPANHNFDVPSATTPLLAEQAELPCEEVAALLPLVADGAINAESDPALFAHLARCCDCQEALASHDVVTIALEYTSPTPSVMTRSRRAPIRHVFLPWPAALAASLAAVVGLWMWLSTQQNGQTAPQTSTTQVVQVMSSDGHPLYVVVEGEQVTVIDPRNIDGKATVGQPQVQPVKFVKPTH